MKVMLTVYYDEQEEEFTRVVYEPEWLQANPFLRDNTLHDVISALKPLQVIVHKQAVEEMRAARVKWNALRGKP
ncbi:hypothetical protein UFOVP1017_19 [uncultured Caudovirales phage]|uniref:Uncharacterized protein n=1 Tax=uncultured Caudovirales phage TaxID=2100421 RepID=A0A6J5QFQ4_9CAUD|nr:hypothetical protein UFOVP511_19 [uncultured Caudovirales phage]CAB4178504.1 hypothetical protein UFOVP1017_19 [uncultured Caudovirales phage]CAB4187866.1 hypothetical protein UFOVP1168_19 [uncultured Caudovirales phage]CAB4219601.1 hypothetical protein UFOVP1617_34 [uncultured Caudovirales phage]